MKTTSGSALAIGFYPTFKYNASGGGGLGKITAISGSRASIEFDPQQVLIPPLSWRTGEITLLQQFWLLLENIIVNLSYHSQDQI